MNKPLPHTDAYAPAEIAQRVESAGVSKAALGAGSTLVLAVLAGAFIALGAALFTLTVADNGLPFSLSRLLGGLTFCLGLILVIVAGAELFTGNNLIVMAWASRRVSTVQMLRNWALVYAGNLVGALGTAVLVFYSGIWALDANQVGASAVQIAAGKTALGWPEAFVRGVLCNALVCLAVWLCFSARSTTDKILSILFPITAFVALGFEHSVANMYFLPMGVWLAGVPEVASVAGLSISASASLGWMGVLGNLLAVTLGNIIGGALLVAAVYRWVYLRNS